MDFKLTKSGVQVVTGFRYGRAKYFTKIMYQMTNCSVKCKIKVAGHFPAGVFTGHQAHNLNCQAVRCRRAKLQFA
jgi:hypothetical protein